MAETLLGTRLEQLVRQRAARAAAFAAVQMEVALKREFQPHRKSGDTQASVAVRLSGLTATSVEYTAVATTPQARFVNDGTPRHPIRARTPGGYLRFQWPAGPPNLRSKDGYYYFHEVDHPGYVGDPWWDRTIALWPELVAQAFGRL